MVTIPDTPPPRAVTLRRYVDSDLRKVPERLALAVKIAKAYHDDWPPMVEAAASARHNNTLPIGVARMVLNAARTRVDMQPMLEEFEWSLMEDSAKEGVLIDLEERAQAKEIRRREAEEEAKNQRSTHVRTKLTIHEDVVILVAKQNGQVLHAVDHHADNYVNWQKQFWRSRFGRYKFYDEHGMDWPPSTIYVQPICSNGGFKNFADPYLYREGEAPELRLCKTGCWETEES
jgi:hypothetical protein